MGRGSKSASAVVAVLLVTAVVVVVVTVATVATAVPTDTAHITSRNVVGAAVGAPFRAC